MLAPRASSAFVCLRCELKAARPRTSALPAHPSPASFSTSARRHNVADESEAPSLGEPVVQKNRRNEPLRISREYQAKGKIVLQRKAKLKGMRRMDEEADILVINEKPEPVERDKVQPEPLEPISVPDIFSSLQREDAPASPEDVARQFESLRPSRDNADEPYYVTTADFIKLVAALTRGFTTVQLSQYLSAAKNIKQETLYQTVKATVNATKRSAWHPTTTNIEKRLPGVETIRHPIAKQKSKPIRKATLVDKILRDVWKLEILEEIEAPGELELKLREWQLKLLQAGDNETTLARIAKIRNAKVEIHWPTNVLRITADKNTAEYTANDVEAVLNTVQLKDLDLTRWVARLDKAWIPSDDHLTRVLAQKDMDLVSALTRTHIAAYDKNIIKIHGFDETSVAEAERSLIRLLPFKASATRTIDTQRLDAAKNESYLLPTFHEPKSLEHPYRDLSLGRWALPVTHSTNALASEQPGELQNSEQSIHSLTNRIVSFMRPPVDGGFTGPESTSRDRETGYWYLEPEYKVSADFGQALFPLEHSDPNKVVEAASDSLRSPFQPAIPGLGSLLASSNFDRLSRTETPALSYDLIPAPDQEGFDSDAVHTLPKLHIQVRTGRDGNRPTIHKLSLGFKERVHDVLLPDQAADIRFYRYGRLRFTSKSHHDKNVEEWSEAVRQNVESGGRLSAPSLTLDIPKWTIPGYSSDAKGMLPVKYLFSGIQFRQSVTGRLLDTQISYSTMQSGKLGAKGGVLSAYCPTLQDDQHEAQIRDFATKCIQMVDYITQAGAQTEPLKQAVLPRNEYSARKQRRAALQEGGGQTQDLDRDQDEEQISERNQELVESTDDMDDQDDAEVYDETQSFLSDEDEGTSITSRFDADLPATDVESAADEAQSEADESKTTARGKLQKQEADALLDDLFGDEDAMAASAKGESEEAVADSPTKVDEKM